MKRLFSIIFFLSATLCGFAQNTKVNFTVKGAENKSVILGYYFNKQLLIKDTIPLNHIGSAVYQQSEKLPEGMYVLYFPNQTYLDFVIGSDQTFSVTTSQTDMLPSTSITGSEESEQFLLYQKFIAEKQKEFEELRNKYGDENQTVKDAYQRIDKEVGEYSQRLTIKYKGSFLSLFLKGLREIELPDYKHLQTSLPDSVIKQKQYYYYREHFFDNIAVDDSRTLRTPYFPGKIDSYFNDIVPQIPDTVALEAVKLIEKGRTDREMFKYLVSYLYNLVNESKIMGMDAALVAIAERYYLSGDAWWADEKFIADLAIQVQKIKPTMIGKIAPDLKMGSLNQQYYRLHEVNSPFTILVFWETDCGHCQKDIPELHKIWESKLSKDTKVFCVYTQTKADEWQKFIEEHQMENWINVYDPRNSTNFRTIYNINSTPQIFILDKDKKIVAKKIGVSQVVDVIEYLKKNK